MKFLKKYWWLLLLLILALGIGGFYVWASDASGPMPEALAALESDELVTVETEPWLIFTPTGVTPTTGFIFYPGGKVDYRSYAPQARDIAEAGYLVVIPEMPLNLAVFDANAADDIIAAYPDIENWAIGGHSLGGSMAAKYVYDNPDAVDGLVLWASYPASNNSLAQSTLPTTSIWGTEDGGVDGIVASPPLMPANTIWVEIEGGNHAQFGWYGPQAGDNPATISREEQQAQTVAATVELLAQLDSQ
ncbi:MAG: alpha/beta hydrolase [Anaerolineae bacterium]|nr:alpha/beta hydrolase [Anaerolineae bacterium]